MQLVSFMSAFILGVFIGALLVARKRTDPSYVAQLEGQISRDSDSILYLSKLLQDKSDRVEKLKQLILLTDPALQNTEVSTTTLQQWQEYNLCYPDEVAYKHIKGTDNGHTTKTT